MQDGNAQQLVTVAPAHDSTPTGNKAAEDPEAVAAAAARALALLHARNAPRLRCTCKHFLPKTSPGITPGSEVDAVTPTPRPAPHPVVFLSLYLHFTGLQHCAFGMHGPDIEVQDKSECRADAMVLLQGF